MCLPLPSFSACSLSALYSEVTSGIVKSRIHIPVQDYILDFLEYLSPSVSPLFANIHLNVWPLALPLG